MHSVGGCSATVRQALVEISTTHVTHLYFDGLPIICIMNFAHICSRRVPGRDGHPRAAQVRERRRRRPARGTAADSAAGLGVDLDEGHYVK